MVPSDGAVPTAGLDVDWGGMAVGTRAYPLEPLSWRASFVADWRKRKRWLLPSMWVLAATILCAPDHAWAQNCFRTPSPLPGLSGPPNWSETGTRRTELNEPRWAAAPQTGFDSDDTDTEGFYRILVNSDHTELSVSFQAPVDPGSPTAADEVYFGLTRDGTSGTIAAAVRLHLPASGSDPVPITEMRGYKYNGSWTTEAINAQPTWLKAPAGWIGDPTAAWGINFKVDLTDPALAGIDLTSDIKLMLAMHIRDESDPAASLNPSTPNRDCVGVGCPYDLHEDTLLIDNSANWATFSAFKAGCPGGITISGTQLGTTNVDEDGKPAPHLINTTPGATNTFYARPSYDDALAPHEGMLQARFYIASVATPPSSDVVWTPIPNGSPLENGTLNAVDVDEFRFTCPPNEDGQVCGVSLNDELQQCVYIELRAAPGQVAPLSNASAYFCSPAPEDKEDPNTSMGGASSEDPDSTTTTSSEDDGSDSSGDDTSSSSDGGASSSTKDEEDSRSDAGCGCHTGPQQPSGSLWWLGLGAFGLVLVRRRCST